MTVQAPSEQHLRAFAWQGFGLLFRRLVEFNEDHRRAAIGGFCLLLRRLAGSPVQMRRDTLAALRKPLDRPSCPGPWRSPTTEEDGTPRQWCDRTGREVVWFCEHTNRPSHKTPQTCDKTDCHHDYGRVARRRGRRVFASIGGAPMAAFVFTMPHELRVLGPVQLHPLRRELGRLIRRWAAARWGVDVGPVVHLHPCGDVCEACGLRRQPQGEPLSRTGACARCGAAPRWKPHFDAVMPCFGLAGRVGSRQRVKRIPYHIEREDLAALKVEWSALVRQVAAVVGVELPPRVRHQLARGLGVVDYRFRLKHAHKSHRTRYSMRHFPAWAAALPRALNSYQRFGLAAGNPTFGATLPDGEGGRRRLTAAELERFKESIDRWRAAVAGQLEPEKKVRCKCCSDPQPCYLGDIARGGHHEDGLAYGHLRLYVSGDDEPPAG